MRIFATLVAACSVTIVVTAQAPAANPTNKTGVIGFMHAIHSTNDIDQTLAFYQAVFALGGQVRPFQSTGPQILTDSPGATLRVAMTQLKGAFNFELTQFGNVERQLNKRPDIADPGAPMMKIIVRDIDAVVAAAKKVNAPIVTKGATPVTVTTSIDKTKAIANACGMAIRVGHIRDVLAKIKASGGRVLSRNGELVEWSDTIRNVFVKDPNGFNLELVGSADPAQ